MSSTLTLEGPWRRANAERMKDYAERMSVMQNLRVTDILQGIIDNFNAQLIEANASVYDSGDTELRTQFAAPFLREEGRGAGASRLTKSNLLAGTRRRRSRLPTTPITQRTR